MCLCVCVCVEGNKRTITLYVPNIYQGVNTGNCKYLYNVHPIVVVVVVVLFLVVLFWRWGHLLSFSLDNTSYFK